MVTESNPNRISVQEYLAAEETALVKHEYFDGVIYAMSGGTRNHADLIGNVTAALITRLRSRRCRGSSNDHRVKIEAANVITYPDFVVKCPPERYAADDAHALTNPALIAEVLSPSTESYDRNEKFALYARIPELLDYILVGQDRVSVDHFQRGPDDSWVLHRLINRDDILRLPNLEIEVPVAEIYERIEVPDGLVLQRSPDMPTA